MDARPIRVHLCVLLLGLAFTGPSRHLLAQGPGGESFLIREASVQLEGYMVDPSVQIPPQVLVQAEGIAVFPELVKAGFVIGARHGRGVLIVRNADRTWSQPIFITLTSASIGLQAGVQSTDLVLVFMNRQSVRRFLMGKGTLALEGNMSIAAGPTGAQLGGATNPRLSAEIMAYGRNRGLFAGLAAGGSSIAVARRSNLNYYGAIGANPSAILQAVDMPIAEEVVQLLNVVDRLSGSAGSAERQISPAPRVRVLPGPEAPVIESAPIQSPAHDFLPEPAPPSPSANPTSRVTPRRSGSPAPSQNPAPTTSPNPSSGLPLPPEPDEPVILPPRRESRPTETIIPSSREKPKADPVPTPPADPLPPPEPPATNCPLPLPPPPA